MPGPGNVKKCSKKKAKITSESNTLPTQPILDFCSFLKIAHYKNIGQFCTWASSTSDGVNLRALWDCAMEEGEKLGIKKGKKLGLEEELERGIDLGLEEGYWVAKEGFNMIIQAAGTPKKSTTHEMAMQTNDNLQWQSTATQMTPTSTVNPIMQMVANNEKPLSWKIARTSTDSCSSQTTPSIIATDHCHHCLT
jgi:hypothetical protein